MEPNSIPHPSLSRDLQSHATPPLLVHALRESHGSILSLAANQDYIFSGNQNHNISVWDKELFQLKHTLRGHTGSVLALDYAEDKKWLFSASGDSTVRVWSTDTLQLLYVINPYLETGAGDLFSLSWSSTLQTIYVGCQNTSLQWFAFRDAPARSSSSLSISAASSGICTPTMTASRKAHKFFDSYPQYERKPADIYANNGTPKHCRRDSPDSSHSSYLGHPQEYVTIPTSNVIDSAHYGYVYCMAVVNNSDRGVHLATGSGDETVKIWDCGSLTPTFVHEFSCNHGAVLALVGKGDTIYAGCQDGYVKVLDLETKTLVRTIIVQEGIDILSMSMLNSDLYTCSANGWVKRWSASFDCVAALQAHQGITLSSIITKKNGTEDKGFHLVTGGNDEHIKIWAIVPPRVRLVSSYDTDTTQNNKSCIGSGSIHDTMAFALSKFVSIPSISCNPDHREDCRQAAIWLRKCLGQLGACTSLLPTGDCNNPLVLATFEGSIDDKPKPRILFYGHYDVVSAPPDGWTSPPFSLTGRNGYLYGRGVTDDKGPIIAVACAAAELLSRRALEVDLVFLIEGEEEVGSVGFKDAVQKHKALIGNIDAILVSNSTWIADDQPCITYGLRGVVHCGLEVTSDGPDLHSGIEGGAVVEPMIDIVRLLATMIDSNRVVQIPGFYDRVRPQTTKEEQLYKLLSEIIQKPASLLSSCWREPSLTIHKIEISGPKDATIIPGTVKAQLSLRIVPDQDLDTIVKSLRDHVRTSFDLFQSTNSLEINIDHTADWWLGNLDDQWFRWMESAVKEEWGVEPLRIREGGSIPSVPYLEKEFACHALHLPMGQSSDQAHLPDERICLANLHKGKAVVERFLLKVSQNRSPHSSTA